jgi:hypothetical protein
VHRLRHKVSAWRVRVNADRVRSNFDLFSAYGTRQAFAYRPNGAVRRLGRIDSLMFAGNDELAIIGVVEVQVVLGEERASIPSGNTPGVSGVSGIWPVTKTKPSTSTA